jgi:DNA polymerase iota
MEEKKAAEEFRLRQYGGPPPSNNLPFENSSKILPTQVHPLQGFSIPAPLNHPPQSQPQPPPDSARIILHFDADCFYAQCEELRDPTLRQRPLGVTQKFLIVTCNYVARGLGVQKLMSIKEAVQRCPELVLINGEDLTPYRHASKNMISVLKRYGTVQKLGLDEIFVDITAAVDARVLQQVGCGGGSNVLEFAGHVHVPGQRELQQDNKYRPMDLRAGITSTAAGTVPVPTNNNSGGGNSTAPTFLEPSTTASNIKTPSNAYKTAPWWPRLAVGSVVAREARHAVKAETGLRTSAGISCNKLLSKLCSGLHKPDDQTLLLPCYAAEFVEPLPVRALPSVGLKLEAELVTHGIETVGALRKISEKVLVQKFGERVGQFLSLARWGKDSTDVVEQGPPKSITVEDSFRSCRGYTAAKQVLQVLAPDLVIRIKEEEEENGRRPSKLILKWRVKGQGWNRTSASCAFPVAAMMQAEELERVAAHLLAANVKEPFDLTLISIGGTGFVESTTSSTGGSRSNERNIADMLLGQRGGGGGGGGNNDGGGAQQKQQLKQQQQQPETKTSPAIAAGLSLKRRRDYGTGADLAPLSKHAERMLRQGGGGGSINNHGAGIKYDDEINDEDMDLWDDLAGLHDYRKQQQRTGSRNGASRVAAGATTTAAATAAPGDIGGGSRESLNNRVIIHW